MTIVNIFLHDVSLNWERGDSVIFSAPVFREGTSGSIVSTAPVRVPLEPDGTATVELEPGPVDVQFKCRAIKDDQPKRGVVPDEGPVSLEEVIGGAFKYTPAVVNRALDQIEGAVNERLDDVFGRKSTNLFNADKITPGVSILPGEAALTENSYYAVSDPIPVTESTYVYANALRGTYLDANGEYVAHADRGSDPYKLITITNPAITHMRLTVRMQDLGIAQLNAGDTLLPYEPGKESQISAERLDLSGVQPAGDYIEGQVTPEDTSFFQGGASTNLFDLGAVTQDKVILSGTSEPVENTQYVLSAPIPIVPGETYSVVSYLRLTWLDADGEHVGTKNYATLDPHPQVTAPLGAVSVRISASKAMSVTTQFNLGPTLLPYEPGAYIDPTIPARYLDLPDVLEGHLQQPANLFNPDTATHGWVLLEGSGTPSENIHHSLSAPISVVAGETYSSYRPIRVSFFSGEVFVSSTTLDVTTAQTWAVPADVTSVRLTMLTNYLSAAQLNKGSVLLPYEPWHPPYIKNELLPTEPWFPLHPEDPFIVDTAGLDEVFTAPTIDDKPELYTVPATEVYGWWDALVTEHPTYVSRRDLGKASDGITPLYAYVLKPEEVPNHTDRHVVERLIKPLPAAFLMSGTHGYEETGVYALWRMAKDLCEEWHTSPVLDALRWNIEIIAVPLVNPVGWDATGNFAKRQNANGVDLARNFSTGWRLSPDPTVVTYSGPAPLSEPESQAIDALMAEVAHRCVFGTSFHNFSASADRPWMIWNVGGTQMVHTLGQRLISRMSRKWRQEQDWITLPDRYFGYSDMELPGGAEGMALVGHGIPGSTFETSQRCYLDGTAGVSHTTRPLTLGYEAVVNYTAMGISEGLKLKPAPQ